MFKVGDKVRRIKGSNYPYANMFLNNVYTVENPKNEFGHFVVKESTGRWDNVYFELVEAKKVTLFQLEEGKTYRANNGGLFRLGDRELLQSNNSGSSYHPSCGGIGSYARMTFEEIIIKPLKVDSLNYEVEKLENGNVKVGCQEITGSDFDKIVAYVKGSGND